MDLDSPSPPPPGNPTTEDQRPPTVTPSERIAELNQIDLSISTLLSSASTATSILSNHSNTNTSSTNTSLSTSKSQFTTSVQTYFSTLSSIEVRLRRQIYALEEAGLIAPGSERDARRGRVLNSADDVVVTASGGGRKGGGPLDPSWLNARGSESVEVEKKKEILRRGLELVRRLRSEDEVEEDGRDVTMK